jgi:purine-binding chemotaxis protein CheW
MPSTPVEAGKLRSRGIHHGESSVKHSNPFLVFAVEGQKYALPLETVARIVRAVEITSLPKAPPIVIGIVNFRGRVVPVVNLRRRFGLPEREMELSDQLVVANTPARPVALLADRVEEVVEIDPQEIIDAGRIVPQTEYLAGVVKASGSLVLIHDLATFLSLDEDAALTKALSEKDGPHGP